MAGPVIARFFATNSFEQSGIILSSVFSWLVILNVWLARKSVLNIRFSRDLFLLMKFTLMYMRHFLGKVIDLLGF